jgi:hypothetical protein
VNPKQMDGVRPMHYEIIGDIHGHCDKLLGLLAKLGYVVRLVLKRVPKSWMD